MSEVFSGSHLCGCQVGYHCSGETIPLFLWTVPPFLEIVLLFLETVPSFMETVPLSGDCATIAGDTLPLFLGFDEMSNMIVHCISTYSCLQSLVPSSCRDCVF